MFESVLIANRGEIACRVMGTAERLGIRTIAVYSDADVDALHVELADEAYRLGPAAATESYLNGTRLLEIAKRAGAQAVHPGYGFLAENARFAEACIKAGVVFIGPPAEAIRAMGSKSAALELMSKARVPVLPGYRGGDQSDEALLEAAKSLGFPLMVKPVAGGGGKGMRIVTSTEGFKRAIESSRREALAAFGDGELLLERYLEHARHVEVQVFADTHGNVLHLYERDCSIQRRHQKVIEEAPAPGLSDALRERMGAVAVRAAEAIGYVGAGTVEFLLDPDAANQKKKKSDPFFFMEMNTRLQVEHPVTEMVLGVDLVEWQLRVASGEPLPKTSAELVPSGHAVEARIYAEDPCRGFLPASGRLTHLKTPTGPGVRVDTGVRKGDIIGVHYDPMIAKLIAHGRDRTEAVRRLSRALKGYEILGVTTNVAYLSRIVAHPSYVTADFDTGFVERFRDALMQSQGTEFEAADAAVAAVLYLATKEFFTGKQAAQDNPSPWSRLHGFRLNADAVEHIRLRAGEETRLFTLKRSQGGIDIVCNGEALRCSARFGPNGSFDAHIDGRRVRAAATSDGCLVELWLDGNSHRFTVVDPNERRAGAQSGHGHLTAPMPGKIIAVMVEPGAVVTRGQPLVTMEAMKMEHTVAAPFDGVVETIRFEVGDLVSEGADLIHLTAQA
ncbi:MAG: acetyl/propionyl/methylcrotonyl-CoA carboxylase subunit alpha [Gammaproteobacteria bacterium]|nr:acetyl/propionyl/methylcrotonyl-CoA carboxylase subunit alpha [Gammaproteobacteria bacterium]MDH3411873.1 acetyl/propionyl/methylcrotonyl-CoA carboxylase subunit alpha [Gammaproteobacteria bacterium]